MTPPLRVLLIDDSSSDIFLIQNAAEMADTDVELSIMTDSHTAVQALTAMLPQELPELVLLDLNMPRVSGFDILKAMKASPALQPPPVVIFTTSNAEHDQQLALELGADDFVTKPFKLNEVMSFLNNLEKYRPTS